MVRNDWSLAAVIACALFGNACVRYAAQPIQPEVLETQFLKRGFNDAGLRDYARRECGNAGRTWPPSAFDVNALVCAALYFHPDIGIARTQLNVAQAAMVAARTRPSPSLSAEGGYNRTPESVSTYAVSPVFTIETAGKRGYRILEAEKLTAAARLSLAETAWRVRSDVRAAFVTLCFARRQLALLVAQAAIDAEVAEIYRKRLEAGEAGRPEWIAAHDRQASTAVSVRASEGNVAQTLAALAAAIGVPEAALESARLNPTALDNPPSAQSLPVNNVERAGLLHRSDIKRSLDEYAAAEAHVRLEIANQYPDIPLTPAYSLQEGYPSYTLGSALDSIPVFNRHRGPIAQAEARRAELKARFIALQTQAIGETASALAQYSAAVKVWTEARDRLQPAATDRARAARAALAAGDADRLELAAAKAAGISAERIVGDALERVQSALGALEHAVQAPLSGSEDALPGLPD